MSTSVFMFGSQGQHELAANGFQFSFKQNLAKTQKLQTFDSSLFSFGTDANQVSTLKKQEQEMFQFGLYHKKTAAFSYKPSSGQVFHPVNTANCGHNMVVSSLKQQSSVIDYQYERQSYLEANKENIDPLSGVLTTARPNHSDMSKGKFDSDRTALKDITNTYQCLNQKVSLLPSGSMPYHIFQESQTQQRATKRSRSDGAVINNNGSVSKPVEMPVKFVPADYEKEQQLLTLFKGWAAPKTTVIAENKSVFSTMKTMSKTEQKNVFKKVVKLR